MYVNCYFIVNSVININRNIMLYNLLTVLVITNLCFFFGSGSI